MTILLIHYPDLYRETITALVEKRYGIKNATFNIKFINQLPYTDNYVITQLSRPVVTDYWGLHGDGLVKVTDIEDYSEIADIVASQYLKPVITWTDELDTARNWLTAIAAKYPIIAVDFESKDLTLPQFNKLTMVTIGWHRAKSIVIVFNDQLIQDYVLNWLVTTECRQVYHNALFDTRLIHYETGKLPKHIEDSQLLAKVYRNHVERLKQTSSLKELAKFPYLDWASDKTSFDLYLDSALYVNTNLQYVGSNPNTQLYNLPLIYYCGVDSCATYHVWTKFDTEPATPSQWVFQHSEPRVNLEKFNQRYYYEFILKPAIPVIVRMLNKGQSIDLEQVHTLAAQVKEVKDRCLKEITQFKMVQDFMEPLDKARLDNFLKPVLKAWKHPQETKFKANPAMRAFVVNQLTGSTYQTLSDKELKLLTNPALDALKNKDYNTPEILEACRLYAENEATRQNIQANRLDKVTNPEKYIHLGFNPYNYGQLTQMWLTFGLESDEISKETGQMSFNGKVLQKLAKTTTGDLQKIIQLYLEIAESKNMVTQYIPKYLGSTINDRVYGSIRLMGTISGRLSGKAAKMTDDKLKHCTGINLVTQPSSSSAFAKPVKKLFNAPEGKLVIAIDYANLEGHVGAILTHDKTSIRNLQENFDTHCLHSAAYWTEAWEQLSGIKFDKTSLEINKKYKELSDTNPIAAQLRSKSKGVTFGLAYGAYPKKIAHAIDCSMEEAQTVFDNYHNVLYPGVTAYREEYVLPSVDDTGFIHLNWGLPLHSTDARKDIRTLNNSTIQGYSNLTQIAAVEFDRILHLSDYAQDIHLTNIVHDCLYYEITNNLEIIKFLNDTLPPIMCRPFIKNQVLTLKAEVDIGTSLGNVVTLPNNASLQTIQDLLLSLKS